MEITVEGFRTMLGITIASSFFPFLTQSQAAPQPPSGLDPTIIAALIGIGDVVVGALIAGAFAFYQTKKTAQIEKQRQEEQFQHEKK